MASEINRTAILINLALFVGFGVFCISTQAPLVQQDILRRCREALAARRLPWEGLSVDGRDVILSGSAGATITSPQTQAVIRSVPGVRQVRVSSYRLNSPDLRGIGPETSAEQRALQDKLDRVLENQSISFKTDSSVLTPDGEKALENIAAYLASSPTLRCEIRSYGSQSREEGQNWILPLQRALATEDYLVSKGIAEWRLSAHAFQNGASADSRRTDAYLDLVVRAK